MRFSRAIFIITLLAAGIVSNAQEKPSFWDEIRAFKKQDSISFPASKGILFIGSSSFTRWKDVNDQFKGYPIINRGFGGSTIPDQLMYVKQVVFPYKPKQVVIYCGDNDLASSNSVTPQVVLQRFVLLFNRIRGQLPQTHIAYVAIKPSPSRQMLAPKAIEANRLIRNYLRKKPRTAFIDIYKEMIDDEGKPLADLFVEDNLHMNAKGYAIWQRMIAPHLLK